MKVLVLNLPPTIMREECCIGYNKHQRKFPALLSQVTTILSHHVDVDFFDANVEGIRKISDLKPILLQMKPSFIITSITNRYLKLEIGITEICNKLGIKSIVIPLPFEYAEEFVDKYHFYFAIYSEPEKTLLDWCTGTKIENLKGIVYKNGGKLIKNSPQDPYFNKLPPIS